MPKCPECEYDLSGGEEICPKCQTVLGNTDFMDGEEDGLVELYATNDHGDAEQILAMLEDAEINVELQEEDGGEDSNGELLTEYRILVDIAQADEARDQIEDAIDNDEIGDSGWFLSTEDDD